MKPWEYITAVLYGDLAPQLNAYGSNCWELVSARPDRSDGGYLCIFKRPAHEGSK